MCFFVKHLLHLQEDLWWQVDLRAHACSQPRTRRRKVKWGHLATETERARSRTPKVARGPRLWYPCAPPPTRLHNEKPFLIAMRKGGDCTARQAANFISILPLLLLLNSSMPFSSSKPANLLTGANREALHFSTPKNPPLSLPPIRRAGGGGGRFHTRQIGRLF